MATKNKEVKENSLEELEIEAEMGKDASESIFGEIEESEEK